MFSRIVILIVGVLVAINAAQEETKREEVEGYWYPCGEELKTPLMSEDIKVFIPDCPPINGSETRCQMKKGTESILKIQFKSTETIPSLERIMVARVPVAGKFAEMPYGPAISPCVNSSMVANDGTFCFDNGVQANKTYVYTTVFKVLKSFPTVSDITTRIILRQKNEKHHKIRLYKKHPGPNVFCIVIPNIDVIDVDNN